MAASIAVMTMMITVTWMMRPTDSLAHDVVAHVNSESPSQPGFAPIDAGALQDVLRKSGVRAHLTSNEVIHEKTCLFRWHFVPHLVVQTSDGPITLVILPDEQVEKRARFQEGGLAGVILPASRGSIVVLARNETRVDEFAGRLQKARLGS
jgi:hypothetical protein